MKIAAASVDDYLARAPAEHRQALARVRDVMRRNLPAGYEEGLLYGMISWYVPPERLGRTYNGQPLGIASLASQKNYMALYLMNVYGNPDVYPWFTSAFAAAGKKLDMGKSCVRFRALDDLPLEVIAKVASLTSVDAHIAQYEEAQGSRKQKPVVMARPKAAKTNAAKTVKASPPGKGAKKRLASSSKAAASSKASARVTATKPGKASSKRTASPAERGARSKTKAKPASGRGSDSRR